MTAAGGGGSLVFDRLLSVPAPTTVRGQSTKLGASQDGSVVSYGAGKVAVLRSTSASEGPGSTQLFTQHTANVTVTKVISPYYAASGDAHGNLKVWDTTGNQSIKLEAKPISRITDLSCDGEGKRILVVGEGKQAFGATFNLDTGSSVGEVSGHSKPINAVASKPNRPFRAVTGSDDFSVVVLNGVPFKYASTHRTHTRFVQSVDYAPSGAVFASAASDGVVYLYDGATGDHKGAFVDSKVTSTATGSAAHSSGVYAVSFSRDSKQVATSGADAKIKLWDVESMQVVQTWDMGQDSVLSQQVGNVWAGDKIVSLSFSGDLNVIDPRSPEPAYVLHGHQNPVTAVANDVKSSTFFSGDSAGRVLQTSADGSRSGPVKGVHYSGLVVDLIPSSDGVLTSSFDDTVKKLKSDSGFDSFTLSAGSQPKGLAVATSSSTSDEVSFLATSKDVQVIVSGSKTCSIPQPNSSPTCIACTSDSTRVALGTEDQNLIIYAYSSNDNNLKPIGSIQLRNPPTKLAFSNSNSHLVVGLSTGKLLLYKFDPNVDKVDETSLSLVHSRWTDNTARINSLCFSPLSSSSSSDDKSGERELIVTGSLDESIRVYDLKKPSFSVVVRNAHKGGVAAVVWEDKTTATNELGLVSAGADGCVKKWTLKLA
ncbi:hypothetical protein ACM66B_003534 [Microbotryomycetes sp. NB124-2]